MYLATRGDGGPSAATTDCQPFVSRQRVVVDRRPASSSVVLCSPPVKALATLDPATRGFSLDRRLDTGRLAFMAGLVEVVVESATCTHAHP